jgi:hypothetical protein
MSPKKTIQTFVDGGSNVLWIQWILGLPSMGNWAIMGVPTYRLVKQCTHLVGIPYHLPCITTS